MKRHIVTLVQFIGFLFAAFGGFLTDVAPPAQTNPKFAVGLSSFLTLMALLVVSALAKTTRNTKKIRKRWIRAGVICMLLALVFGLVYPWTLSELTYAYPPPPDAPEVQRINGWEYTATAKEFISRRPGNYSPADLELKLPYEEIWTADSVAQAKIVLLLTYILLVLSIGTGIFCLLEADLKGPTSTRTSRKKKEPLSPASSTPQ